MERHRALLLWLSVIATLLYLSKMCDPDFTMSVIMETLNNKDFKLINM